jgi:hypothetical protein
MIDWEKAEDAGDKDAPRTEALDDAREGNELKDSVYEPISSHPQANRCGTHAEPAKLNRRRPDQRHKSSA